MVTERLENFNELVRGPTVRRPNPRKLSHFIARDLRGLILRGVLAPGHALPSESDLLQTFEVSRNTLREALRILESESLIEIKRGRAGGAIVRRPQPESVARYVSLLLQVRGATVAEIQETRLMIEPGGAARLVENTTTGSLEALAAMQEAERELLEDAEQCVSALSRFDGSVFELAGNKTISVLSSIFRDIISTQRFVGDGSPPARELLRDLADLHRRFLREVAARDHDAAEDTWTTYLSETAKLLGNADLGAPFDVVPVWQHPKSRESMQSNTMAASIANEIRIRIARGDLRDGDQLAAMPDLAAEFGVSRPTMRECLRVLEMEGLVDLRTGSRTGATVLEPTPDAAAHLALIVLASVQTQMADVAEASRLIEPTVAELVAARIDDETLSQVAEAVRALKDLVGNTIAFVEANEAITERLFAAAGNPSVLVAWQMVHSVTLECRRDLTISALSLPKVIRGNRFTGEALEAFVEAAGRRDVGAARAARVQMHEAIAPFFASALGDRLLVDLFD